MNTPLRQKELIPNFIVSHRAINGTRFQKSNQEWERTSIFVIIIVSSVILCFLYGKSCLASLALIASDKQIYV